MKQTRSIFAVPSVLFGLACIALPASGQVMLSPVAASTTIPDFPNNDTVSVTNLINQSGITTPFTSGVTVFDTYFANANPVPYATSGNGGVNNWQGDTAFELGYQGYVDFDLGAVYRINQLAIYNRSLSNVTVKILVDLISPEQVAGDFILQNRLSYPFDYPVELLPFTATYEGRYVRLVINSIFPYQGFSFGAASAGELVASVLPVGSPPSSLTVGVALAPNGDVQVTFTGTLQTSPTVSGGFTNVPGNPSSPYTLPKAGLLPRQFFRAQGN